MSRLRVAVSLCLLLVAGLVAQTNFGRISGAVMDPSGAAIPGAKVSVINADTQAVRTINTDERGFSAT